MPKIKTNRSVAKRFKITGKGKIKRPRAFKGHILGKKKRKRKMHLRHRAYVSKVDEQKIRRLLPYG